MNSLEIDSLVNLLAKLPGLGPRSARRVLLHLIKHKQTLMLPLADAIQAVADNIRTCSQCHNIDASEPCGICQDDRRDNNIICVVEDVSDLWALERAGIFRGRYHVLGGALSALDGIGPENLNIEDLVHRAGDAAVREVILATNATVDGQTTAHYITERLQDSHVAITRPARGVPVGGELDYLDDGTLATAFRGRLPL